MAMSEINWVAVDILELTMSEINCAAVDIHELAMSEINWVTGTIHGPATIMEILSVIAGLVGDIVCYRGTWH